MVQILSPSLFWQFPWHVFPCCYHLVWSNPLWLNVYRNRREFFKNGIGELPLDIITLVFKKCRFDWFDPDPNFTLDNVVPQTLTSGSSIGNTVSQSSHPGFTFGIPASQSISPSGFTFGTPVRQDPSSVGFTFESPVIQFSFPGRSSENLVSRSRSSTGFTFDDLSLPPS